MRHACVGQEPHLNFESVYWVEEVLDSSFIEPRVFEGSAKLRDLFTDV